jgi:hypothetical protein
MGADEGIRTISPYLGKIDGTRTTDRIIAHIRCVTILGGSPALWNLRASQMRENSMPIHFVGQSGQIELPPMVQEMDQAVAVINQIREIVGERAHPFH